MDEEYIPEGFKKIEDDSEEHLIFLTVDEMKALVMCVHPKTILNPEEGYLVWKAFKKFEVILKEDYEKNNKDT